MIMEDKNLQKFGKKITNKAILRPLRVKKIHNHHQINLVDMNEIFVI